MVRLPLCRVNDLKTPGKSDDYLLYINWPYNKQITFKTITRSGRCFQKRWKNIPIQILYSNRQTSRTTTDLYAQFKYSRKHLAYYNEKKKNALCKV